MEEYVEVYLIAYTLLMTLSTLVIEESIKEAVNN